MLRRLLFSYSFCIVFCCTFLFGTTESFQLKTRQETKRQSPKPIWNFRNNDNDNKRTNPRLRASLSESPSLFNRNNNNKNNSLQEQQRSSLKLKVLLILSGLYFGHKLDLGTFLLEKVVAPYESALIRRPLPTKVMTGATLSLVGDAMAQRQQQKSSSYDIRRAASFAAFDSCYRLFQHNAIPIIVRYGQGNVLSWIFATFLPFLGLTSTLSAFCTAMERTLLYQFVLIPLFYYPVFFTFTGLMQGLSLRDTIARAKQNYFSCWRRNLLFWIPVQLVMFGLIVPEWQIPFVCVMGVLWSLILSITAGNAK